MALGASVIRGLFPTSKMRPLPEHARENNLRLAGLVGEQGVHLALPIRLGGEVSLPACTARSGLWVS
jgi:hypothetical protein